MFIFFLPMFVLSRRLLKHYFFTKYLKLHKDIFFSFPDKDLEDQLFQSQRTQKKLEKEATNRQAQEEKLQVTFDSRPSTF